jgi:hypothetical protein
MTHKEYFIWLEGFLTNRDWTVIREIDIETIKEKMSEVREEKVEPSIKRYEQIPVPINPFPKTNDPYISPYEITCEIKTQLND